MHLDDELQKFWVLIVQICSIGVVWDLARENVSKSKLFTAAISSVIIMVLLSSYELTYLLNVPSELGFVCAIVTTLIMTSKLISTALQMGDD